MRSRGDLTRSKLPRTHLNAVTSFAIFPDSVDILLDGGFRATTFSADSAHLGDCIDGAGSIPAR